jgi:predicted nucleic acid-binding protein
MTPIFLDANIFLDVFSHRSPWYYHAARVLSLVETHQITGCTTSLNFSNLFYIIRKERSHEVAMTHLRQLASFISVLAVDEQIVRSALHSAFTDFEDAIQYYTATQYGIAYLLTRNTKDYKMVDTHIIQAMTAEEYLDLWDASAFITAQQSGNDDKNGEAG